MSHQDFLVKCRKDGKCLQEYKMKYSESLYGTFMRKLMKTYNLEKPMLKFYQISYTLEGYVIYDKVECLTLYFSIYFTCNMSPLDVVEEVRITSQDEYNYAIEQMYNISSENQTDPGIHPSVSYTG